MTEQYETVSSTVSTHPERKPDKFNKWGKPIGLLEWARLLEYNDYARVALNRIGRFKISTVWIGLDHSFGTGSKPLIFESMVFDMKDLKEFNGKTFPESIEQRRYSTFIQALLGHYKLVITYIAKYIKNKL